MALYLEVLKRIYRKTHLFFILVIAISLIIFLFFSFYEYSKNKYIPDYNSIIKIDDNFNLENRYHKVFFKNFIFTNTISLLLQNLFIVSLIFYIYCFSLVINKTLMLNIDIKTINFLKIGLHGLYFLIALTILYILSFEFFIPSLEKKIDFMKNNTSRAIISLNKGNEMYQKNSYIEAIYYYEDYLIIVVEDDVIDSRVHEIRNKIQINTYEQNKEKSNNISTTNNLTTTNFLNLARFYFQKKDYYTALYYYTFIAESKIPENREAKEQILLIKKILKYNNDLNIDKLNLSNEEIKKYIKIKDYEIRDIYILKSKADNYMSDKEYHEAYFLYEDILKINPNLNEVINNKNDAYKKLLETGAEIGNLMLAKNYPGKNHFVFILSQNRLMYTGLITKGKNKFYLYDVKIYNFDTNYNFKNVIEAPYGETKSSDTFTLFSFSINNRDTFYFPEITNSNSNKEIYPDNIFKLPSSMNDLYNFSYDYEKTFNSSLINLFKLNNLITETKNFSIGFNGNFIKSAITEKISYFFLFFSINLIIIGLSWRFRSNYVSGIPKIHYIIFLIIPFFVFIFFNLFQNYITAFYSTLAFSFNLFTTIIISLILNIILLLFSLIYISRTK